MITISSPNGTSYCVDEKRIGSTEVFTLYECKLPDSSSGILKIATAKGNNGLLDREAYLLQVMKDEAQKMEEEYGKESGGKKTPLNNHFFFPNLVETFIASDQDNRRASVLNFPDIAKKLSELVPLSYLASDHLRVDPRTSAWILGKLLKLLVFTHQQDISLGEISSENILINKKNHFVCLFDWTKATIASGEISKKVATEEISLVTKEVINILGGSKDGSLPPDEQLTDSRYEDYLKLLISGGESDAYEVHQKFYKLIRDLWPRGYHQFTTKISLI
jgi:serine/threonine protein kinase